MIRVSKLTDYGIILMTYFALLQQKQVLTAKQLSHKSGIPLPTVSKLLKLLSRSELIVSMRGVNGGYSLLKNPKEISVIEMVDIIDGPLALTECSTGLEHKCDLETSCPTKKSWQKINSVVRKALSSLSLEDMANRPSQNISLIKGV